MKTRIFISALLLSTVPFFAMAQETKTHQIEKVIVINEKHDTTEVKIPGISVEVREHGDTVSKIIIGRKKFEVIEEGNRKHVRMVNVPRESFKGHFSGFDLGINMLTTSDFSTDLPAEAVFLDQNAGKSINVGINFLQYSIGLQQKKNNFGLVTGMGLNISNYRFDSPYLLTKNTSTGVTEGVVSERPMKKNKLVTSSLMVPLMLELQLPAQNEEHRVFVAVGGFGSVKLGSHTKMVYSDGEKPSMDKVHSDLNVRPLSYGLTARAGYRFLKLYANYECVSLFEKNRAPEVFPFTVGLTLVNFDY
jgi:hypothetical protein